MPSAREHPDVVSRYVKEEVRGGRILGPFPRGSIVGLHLNRLGVIPKGHTPGQWRLITDLSFPEGTSVNDGINPDLCSLQYITVDEVARAALVLGPGALLAKLDIRAPYRLVPVHPDDCPLLGFQWQGAHYVDGMLPFGLCSAPKLFTAIADALEWMVRQRGVTEVAHYLDDFIVVGPPESPSCGRHLAIIRGSCEELGVPLATDKMEGLTARITFLGIEIDTVAGVLRLPRDKLLRLQRMVQQWTGRRACTRRELESLIGTFQHASRVIRPGRSFLRRMIDLLRIPYRPHHHVRLGVPFRADLQWWATFAERWNGVAILAPTAPAAVEVISDASGHWGCRAWSQHCWFQYQWPEEALHYHIAFKELFALVMACATWGHEWCAVLTITSGHWTVSGQ